MYRAQSLSFLVFFASKLDESVRDLSVEASDAG